jgi:tripartite-type tricarboxylate transporter receptor subunit TctC
MNLRKTATILTVALGCAMPWAQASAQASNYPNKPIRFVVPYQAGGLGDTIARGVAKGLGDRLGQAIIVDNKPGGSQAIGAETVARSAPDGYTLFMGTQSGLILNTLARKTLPYDPVGDFSPVSILFVSPLFLVVNPSTGVKSVAELIAKAKAQPGKLTFASIGQGTSQHLAAEMFKTATNVDMLHVPYKGSASAMTDLVSGQVQVMFEGGMSALPNVKDGKLTALASTGVHRSTEAMPGLPTVAETIPGFHMEVWFGVVAPAGTPKPIINRLNREIAAVLKTPEIHRLALTTGSEVAPSTPDEMETRIKSELRDLGKVMRDAGIEPQ